MPLFLVSRFSFVISSLAIIDGEAAMIVFVALSVMIIMHSWSAVLIIINGNSEAIQVSLMG